MNANSTVSAEQVEEWNEKMQVGIDREFEAFQELLPNLLVRYLDWFVAISGGKVIDQDKNEFVLAERVSKKFPQTFVLIQKVTGDRQIPKGS